MAGTLEVSASGGGGGGGSTQIIDLYSLGYRADGTTQSASAIAALINATTNGAEVLLPYSSSSSKFKLSGPIIPTKPVTFRGYGAARGQSGGTGRTHIEAPAGFPAFIFGVNAQQSRVENLKISQTSLLTTTQLGTYTALSPYTSITLNAAGDFQNNQVIALEGAGPSLVVVGRTAAMTSGSNTVTITSLDDFGNAVGYVGQMVEIAGAGAAGASLIGYIGSWGIGTMTIVNAAGAALNASTTVAAAAITVRAPLVARIVSGGGTTTLTIDSYPDGPQAVSGAIIRHAAPGIHSTIQCHGRGLEIGSDAQVGVILAGITTGGNVADTCSFYDCTLAGEFAGVIFQGNDAQVNSFFACDFAGPRVGVLDDSLLGNYFYGCHWAFNCAFQVFRTSANFQLMGGYVEAHSGWVAASGIFIGTQSIANRGGLKGFNLDGGWLQGPPLKLKGPIHAEDVGSGDGAGSVTGGFQFDGTGALTIKNNGNTFGGSTSATGRIRMWLNAGSQGIVTSAVDLWLNAESGDVLLQQAGNTIGTVSSAGLNMASGKVLKVAGTQVVGAQGASVADATDAASAITQLNALLARVRAHGLIA